jgi:hypothetical protein
MGGFAPVATALIALPILRKPFGDQFTGFIVMTIGGFVMFFAERKPLKEMLPKIVLASAAFGMTNVLQKIVFNQTNFVTGYVFFTIGTFVGSIALLIPSSLRRQIFEQSGGAEPKSRFWYLANRFIAGVGSFLVVFAISRANPAIVEAVSGVRYALVFAGAYTITKWKPLWFREDFGKFVLLAKGVATSLVIAGLVLVGLQGGDGGTSGPH